MATVENKVVLLTGASSGIGAATAEHLAHIGYRKLALVARRKERLEQVADKCKHNGATDILVLCKDLTLAEDCASKITETVARFGQLDALISNAGQLRAGPTRTFALEDWEYHLKINLTSHFLLTRHSLPHLEKTKGCILYTSSVADQFKSDLKASYSASKAALTHFAQCVAGEEAKKGIRINVVCPGLILDEMTMQFAKGANTDKEKKEEVSSMMSGRQPLGRMGTVEEMAKLYAFLISEENSFMAGAREEVVLQALYAITV